jgi:hypothetical protein
MSKQAADKNGFPFQFRINNKKSSGKGSRENLISPVPLRRFKAKKKMK